VPALHLLQTPAREPDAGQGRVLRVDALLEPGRGDELEEAGGVGVEGLLDDDEGGAKER
jgi:hypothetical protein